MRHRLQDGEHLPTPPQALRGTAINSALVWTALKKMFMLMWWHTPVTSAHWEAEAKDCKCKSSLGNLASSCLSTPLPPAPPTKSRDVAQCKALSSSPITAKTKLQICLFFLLLSVVILHKACKMLAILFISVPTVPQAWIETSWC